MAAAAAMKNDLNDFIVNFFQECLDDGMSNDDAISSWSENVNQKNFQELIAGSLPVAKAKAKTPKVKQDKVVKKTRSKSAWLFFSGEQRSVVKTKLGGEATFAEVSAALGAAWQELQSNEEELARYQQMAAADKERVAALSSDEAETSPKEKPKGKRSKTAWLFFSGEQRAPIKAGLGSEASFAEVSGAVGAAWQELQTSNDAKDKAELARYHKLAADDKARLVAEAEPTAEPTAETESPPPASTTSKSPPPKSDTSAVPKKKLTAYNVFVLEKREEVKAEMEGAPVKDVTKRLSEMWKLVSKDDRTPWVVKAEERNA